LNASMSEMFEEDYAISYVFECVYVRNV